MFRNILVATGPSPWSSNAVDTAIRLAAYLRVELVIVYILEDDPQFQLPGPVASDPQLRAEMEAAGQHIVTQAAERATQAQVSHRIVTRWGSIPEQIVALATTNHCDLIVMGTRHLTGDKRLMTGRICNAVIATASCPVLVVPLVQ
jgi:nucleotide-binding universal stress UspA family protein